MIRLFWFNIRMRIIDWCNKPESLGEVGSDWVDILGKL